jgi:hypothetical protein
VEIVREDNKNGDAADGIELRNLLSHGRCQRLNARSRLNAGLLAYVSTVRGQKGQSPGRKRIYSCIAVK